MNIGLGQILIVAVIVLLLFGNVPKLLKDLATGIKQFKNILKTDNITTENTKENDKKSIDVSNKQSDKNQ